MPLAASVEFSRHRVRLAPPGGLWMAYQWPHRGTTEVERWPPTEVPSRLPSRKPSDPVLPSNRSHFSELLAARTPEYPFGPSLGMCPQFAGTGRRAETTDPDSVRTGHHLCDRSSPPERTARRSYRGYVKESLGKMAGLCGSLRKCRTRPRLQTSDTPGGRDPLTRFTSGRTSASSSRSSALAEMKAELAAAPTWPD